MRLFGPPDIEKLEERRDVNGLVKALRYDCLRRRSAPEPSAIDERRRKETAALTRLAGALGDDAVPPLARSLAREDDEVRLVVVKILGQCGARAVEPLIGALGDDKDEIRAAAGQALGEIREARAVEPLIATLHDEQKDVRIEAVRALKALGDARAVEPLIATLHDEADELRLEAVRSLKALGDARAVEPLIAALDDKVRQVRSEAAEALKSFGGPSGERAEAFLVEEARKEEARKRAEQKRLQAGEARLVAKAEAARREEKAARRAKAREQQLFNLTVSPKPRPEHRPVSGPADLQVGDVIRIWNSMMETWIPGWWLEVVAIRRGEVQLLNLMSGETTTRTIGDTVGSAFKHPDPAAAKAIGRTAAARDRERQSRETEDTRPGQEALRREALRLGLEVTRRGVRPR